MPTLLHSPFAIQKPPVGAQVDWRHPLASGLVAVWLCNELKGIAPSVLVVGRGAIPPRPSVGDITWVGSTKGSAVKFASSVFQYGNLGFLDAADNVSCVLSIRPDSLSQVAGIVQKRRPIGNAWSFGLGYNATSKFTCSVGSAVTADNLYCEYEYSTSGWSTTAFQQIIGAYDKTRGATARWRCWRNGIEMSATFPQENAISVGTTTDVVEIGRVNNSTLYYAGSIEYIYLYRRTLQPPDVAWLYEEPFAMFRTPDVWRSYLTRPPIQYTQSEAGALTSSGSIARQVSKVLGGDL